MISALDKILILSGTLWVVAVGFVIFSWILQARQQVVLRYIAVRLEALEKKVGQLVERSEEKPAGQGLLRLMLWCLNKAESCICSLFMTKRKPQISK